MKWKRKRFHVRKRRVVWHGKEGGGLTSTTSCPISSASALNLTLFLNNRQKLTLTPITPHLFVCFITFLSLSYLFVEPIDWYGFELPHQKGTSNLLLDLKFKSHSWCSFMLLCFCSRGPPPTKHIRIRHHLSWSSSSKSYHHVPAASVWWNLCGWRRWDTSHDQWQVWWPLYSGE